MIRLRRASLAGSALLAITVAAAACSGGGKASAAGTGQVTMSDVIGISFAGAQPQYQTHQLRTAVHLPAGAAKVDASSDFSMTPVPHGCRIERFDAGRPADADGGDVTFSGYNFSRTLFSPAITGTAYAATTAPVTCTSGSSGSYDCRSSGGADTSTTIFPLVPLRVVATSDPNTVLSTFSYWPYTDGDCILREVLNPQDPGNGSTRLIVCEQRPTLPVSEITETLAGGPGYGASNALIGTGSDFPFRFIVTSVKSGGTEVAGVNPVTAGPDLSLADGALAPQTPVTVSFMCLATNGAGCVGNLAELDLRTSASRKTAFQDATVTSEADCFLPITAASSSYTMTLSAAQFTAFLEGQSGGSIRMDLVNLTPQVKVDGKHTVLFGAGSGTFGYTNE